MKKLGSLLMQVRTKHAKESVNVALARLWELAASGDAARFHEFLWSSAELVRAYLTSFSLQYTTEEFTQSYVGDALPYIRWIDNPGPEPN